MINMLTLSYSWLLGLAFVNFTLCSLICWSCFCRLRTMSAETVPAPWRLRYVVLMVAASTSALSPWWNEWPGPGQICMALGALYVIGLTAVGWKGGPPSYALRRDRVPNDWLRHVGGGRR